MSERINANPIDSSNALTVLFEYLDLNFIANILTETG